MSTSIATESGQIPTSFENIIPPAEHPSQKLAKSLIKQFYSQIFLGKKAQHARLNNNNRTRPNTSTSTKTRLRGFILYLKLIRSALLLLIVALVMVSFQVLSDQRYLRRTHLRKDVMSVSSRLPDLFLDNVESMRWFSKIPAQAADWSLNSFLIISLILSMIKNVHVQVLTTFCTLLAQAYALRALSIVVTPLAPSDPRCKFAIDENTISFIQLIKKAFEVMLGIKRTCTDKIFSGHTACATLCTYLHFKRVSKQRSINNDTSLRWFHIVHLALASIYYLITLFLIVACQNHYTVDVVVGIIVTGFLIFVHELRDHRKKIVTMLNDDVIDKPEVQTMELNERIASEEEGKNLAIEQV